MDIFILRHGIAVEREDWDLANDATRPLTPEGEQQIHRTCQAILRLGLQFDRILSSPYERAKRTAEIVAEELKLKKQLQFSAELESEGDPKKLVREINQLKPPPSKVLLVGHEPYLSELISVLVTGKKRMGLDLKKGGLCRLKADALDYDQCASLVWLLTPKQMELMV